MYKVGRFCWENFHSLCKSCPLISSIQPLFHVSHWNWHLYRSSAAIDPPGKLVPLDLEDAFCLPSYGEIVKNTLAMQFFSNVLKLFGFCEWRLKIYFWKIFQKCSEMLLTIWKCRQNLIKIYKMSFDRRLTFLGERWGVPQRGCHISPLLGSLWSEAHGLKRDAHESWKNRGDQTHCSIHEEEKIKQNTRTISDWLLNITRYTRYCKNIILSRKTGKYISKYTFVSKI